MPGAWEPPCGNGCGPDAEALETMRERIRLNTGLNPDAEDLKTVGYRCITLERLFNLREGAGGRMGRYRGHLPKGRVDADGRDEKSKGVRPAGARRPVADVSQPFLSARLHETGKG